MSFQFPFVMQGEGRAEDGTPQGGGSTSVWHTGSAAKKSWASCDLIDSEIMSLDTSACPEVSFCVLGCACAKSKHDVHMFQSLLDVFACSMLQEASVAPFPARWALLIAAHPEDLPQVHPAIISK